MIRWRSAARREAHREGYQKGIERAYNLGIRYAEVGFEWWQGPYPAKRRGGGRHPFYHYWLAGWSAENDRREAAATEARRLRAQQVRDTGGQRWLRLFEQEELAHEYRAAWRWGGRQAPEDDILLALDRLDAKDAIAQALGRLTYREREIIKRRYGLGDGYTYTLTEVGRLFHVSSGRVRHIQQTALRKLARSAQARAAWETM